MNTTKSRKGFTLIELVVTIVLLGALAAIASVSYSAFLSDARGEIAAVESAQDDRIAAAQALLDEEGEYQIGVPEAPAPTPVDGMTLGLSLTVQTSVVNVDPMMGGGVLLSIAPSQTSADSYVNAGVSGQTIAIELDNGQTVYSVATTQSRYDYGVVIQYGISVSDSAALETAWGSTSAVSIKFYS